MAILIDSGTPASDKNFWATTWECFYDAQELYGRPFDCDVAAEPSTTKCSRYFTSHLLLDRLLDYRSREEVLAQIREAENERSVCIGLDSLNLNWPEHWWCNPPFDFKPEFITKARQQQANGKPGMMLLPYEPLTTWWRRLLADEVIIYEPNGRYQFYERDGKTRKNGANFGCALIAFPTMKVGPSPRIPFARGIGARQAV
ncbi:DNA N-6-adenine-methyltransferase [Aeromonas sp. MdU4]|uniref:DNA N-6-adenine-methyltransferase n=1 Tax=Aeromonas sp. MdU4 TaxID=3342819 RepID=UPI0035B998B7